MAAGEYVSVSSQADLEKADLEQEKEELENNTEYEIEELAQIYVNNGCCRTSLRDNRPLSFINCYPE